ncbi:MAG: EF-Tu/IF-2/RF-3 family GTPase [Pyrinomonadaceae bacterium]
MLAGWRSAASSPAKLSLGEMIAIVKRDGSVQKTRVTKLYAFEGLKREPIERARVGEIVALAGIEDIRDRRNHYQRR